MSIRRVLAAGFLLVVTSAAAADTFSVSNEFPTADPRLTALDGPSLQLAASSNNGFLATWRSINFDMRATRISSDGASLDPTGIRVATEATTTPTPSFAFWNGANYAVVVSGTIDAGGTHADRLFEVASDGRLVNPSGPDLDGRNEVMAWSGSRLLRINRDAANTGLSSLASVFDGDGHLVAGPISIPTVSMRIRGAASNGREFLLLWSGSLAAGDQPGYYVSRLSLSGVPLTAPALVRLDPYQNFEVRSNRDGYLLVAVGGSSAAVPWQALNAEGLPVGNPVTPSSAAARTAVSTGSAYAVFEFAYGIAAPSMFRSPQLSVTLVSSEGEVLATNRLPFPASPNAVVYQMAAAFDGRHILLVLRERNQGNVISLRKVMLDPLGRPLDADSESAEGAPLAYTGALQLKPAVASSDSVSAIVWYEQSENGAITLYASRIDSAGRHLDGRGIRIDSGFLVLRPLIDFDGTSFVVMWAEASTATTEIVKVSVARLPLAGVVGPAQDVTSAVSRTDVSDWAMAAGSDGGLLLAWTLSSAAESFFAITRIAPTGAVLDEGGRRVPVATLGRAAGPHVAARNGEFAILWTVFSSSTQCRPCPPPVPTVYAATIGRDGSPRAPVTIRAMSRGLVQGPAIVATDRGYAMSWWEDPGSGAASYFQGPVVVLATDDRLLPVGSFQTSEPSYSPALSMAFDGRNVMVGFRHLRAFSNVDEVRLLRLRSDASLVATTSDLTGGTRVGSVLVAATTNRTLLLYDRQDVAAADGYRFFGKYVHRLLARVRAVR